MTTTVASYAEDRRILATWLAANGPEKCEHGRVEFAAFTDVNDPGTLQIKGACRDCFRTAEVTIESYAMPLHGPSAVFLEAMVRRLLNGR